MLKLSVVPLTIAASAVLYSCGPSKKLQNANSQIEELKVTTSHQAKSNFDLGQEVSRLTNSNNSKDAEFNAYKATCEVTQAKLDEYTAIKEKEDARRREIRNKIEAAMADFSSKGVEVFEKDNRIYVNMQDKLLYKSGSSYIGNDGKKALKNLAIALNDYPDLKVIVVGHTDNVSFRKGSHSDNHRLSTDRANGVVQILRDQNKIDASRLIATGEATSNPIADNSTREGRAKNRRTEIILSPDDTNLK